LTPLFYPSGFDLVGPIEEIEIIAAGSSIRSLARLRRDYGSGRWRKLKGLALVRLRDGRIATAELHWYEPHGIGKKELKLIRVVD
jgi:hypothetical protein